MSVTVDEMQLEQSRACRYDSLALLDGPSSDDSVSTMAVYCGVDTSTVTSSGPVVFVVFQSDGSINKGGFSLSWTFVDRPATGTPATQPRASAGFWLGAGIKVGRRH